MTIIKCIPAALGDGQQEKGRRTLLPREDMLSGFEIIGENFYCYHIKICLIDNPTQTHLKIPSSFIHYSEHTRRNPSRIQEEQSEDNPINGSAKALLERRQ